jgi:serine/threonine-protein kinase RsbW
MMNAAASSQESFSGRFVLNNRREEIELAEQSVLKAVEQRQYDQTSVFAIRLALEEALSNAFKHGNKGDPQKTVRMECRVDNTLVLIDIEDQGEGFDPESVPDPTEQENVEIPSGRGLTLMRAFMTEVMIHPPGNRVLMKYVRPA